MHCRLSIRKFSLCFLVFQIEDLRLGQLRHFDEMLLYEHLEAVIVY